MLLKQIVVSIGLCICIASCGTVMLNEAPHKRSSEARVLFYMHSVSPSPPDIVFTISEIILLTEEGREVPAVSELVDISSVQLIDRQMMIKEAFVEPGQYQGIKIRIAKAFVKGKEGYANLGLPQPDGEVVIKAKLKLRTKESFVISFAWDPEKSFEKGYLFQPYLETELQVSSPRALLLFISNSASNYISVVDRSLERVIGAVTVGERPMGMALNSTQDRLYVVNSGSRSVSVVDTAQFFVLDTIHLTAGMEPTDIAFIPDPNISTEGKLYITNRISNDVTVVSTITRRVIKTITVGTHPSAVAADTVRNEVYVANEKSNTISILSAIDDSLAATIAVDVRPTGFVIGKSKIYVLNEGSQRISIVSPSLRKVVAGISVSQPPTRGMLGFSGRIFVANASTNSVTFLNSQDVVTRTISAGIRPIGLAGDEKRNRLYIANYGNSTISLIDPIGERVLKEVFVGKNPYGVLLLER